jgi:hypothetical protein
VFYLTKRKSYQVGGCVVFVRIGVGIQPLTGPLLNDKIFLGENMENINKTDVYRLLQNVDFYCKTKFKI